MMLNARCGVGFMMTPSIGVCHGKSSASSAARDVIFSSRHVPDCRTRTRMMVMQSSAAVNEEEEVRASERETLVLKIVDSCTAELTADVS